jgi:hypothetical protein
MPEDISDFNWDFDFGFTTVDETEMEVAQKAQQASETVEQVTARLNKLHGSILPLLNNLKQNPDKEYIRWPNRVSKVEEFEAYIAKIVHG